MPYFRTPAEDLQRRLREARGATPELFAAVVEVLRGGSLGSSKRECDIRRFMEAGAWGDAALALGELASPFWKPRRIVYDGGQWTCTMSRRWWRPDWLDEAAEASHPDLPMALLGALLEAHAKKAEASAGDVEPSPTDGVVLCCDNFS
jgi:hypothetical protein